jgi:N-acetylmuramoyl-L-alanine amidase
MRIGIIPGHGGNDHGAVNQEYNLHEAEYNLKEAHKVRELLTKAGHEVIIANDASNWKERKYRSATKMQHEMNNADVHFCFVLHHNASGRNMSSATGWLCFCLKKNSNLLQCTKDAMTRWLSIEPFANQGARFADKGWPGVKHCIELLNMPAVLLESCFVDNANDAQWLATGPGVEEVARAVVETVHVYAATIYTKPRTTLPECKNTDLNVHFKRLGPNDFEYVFDGSKCRIHHLYTRSQAITLLREIFKAVMDNIQREIDEQ